MPSRLIPFTIITIMAIGFMWVTKRPGSSSSVTELQVMSASELLQSWENEKLVLVNFWATWCDPCKDEIPDMVKLHAALKEKGLAVSLVNLENPKTAEKTLKFLKMMGAAHLGVIKPPNTENFFQTLGFEAPAGLPVSGLWSPEKGLFKQWTGVKSLSELELEVKAHLE